MKGKNTDSDHMYEKAVSKGYHGSPKETHKIHGGEVGSPSPLMMASPGKAAMKVKTGGGVSKTEGGANSFKPKGMKSYNEE